MLGVRPVRALQSPAISVGGVDRTHRLIKDSSAVARTGRSGMGSCRCPGMRPLIAHCHHGLGKLYRRTGTREQAQEHLNTAMTMYREMGMTYWLDKATKDCEPV